MSASRITMCCACAAPSCSRKELCGHGGMLAVQLMLDTFQHQFVPAPAFLLRYRGVAAGERNLGTTVRRKAQEILHGTK